MTQCAPRYVFKMLQLPRLNKPYEARLCLSVICSTIAIPPLSSFFTASHYPSGKSVCVTTWRLLAEDLSFHREFILGVFHLKHSLAWFWTTTCHYYFHKIWNIIILIHLQTIFEQDIKRRLLSINLSWYCHSPSCVNFSLL